MSEFGIHHKTICPMVYITDVPNFVLQIVQLLLNVVHPEEIEQGLNIDPENRPSNKLWKV